MKYLLSILITINLSAQVGMFEPFQFQTIPPNIDIPKCYVLKYKLIGGENNCGIMYDVYEDSNGKIQHIVNPNFRELEKMCQQYHTSISINSLRSYYEKINRLSKSKRNVVKEQDYFKSFGGSSYTGAAFQILDTNKCASNHPMCAFQTNSDKYHFLSIDTDTLIERIDSTWVKGILIFAECDSCYLKNHEVLALKKHKVYKERYDIASEEYGEIQYFTLDKKRKLSMPKERYSLFYKTK